MPKQKLSPPIIIGDVKYFKYIIIWEDIVGDSTIADFNGLECATIYTEAYIYKKTKDYVYSFASYDKKDASFGDRNVYPRSIIKSLKRI